MSAARRRFVADYLVPIAIGSAAACVVAAFVAAVARPNDAAGVSRDVHRHRDRGVLAPPISWLPVPYTELRQDAVAGAYGRRYGMRSAILRTPRLVVVRTTGGSSFSGAFDASEAPAGAAGHCDHFVIDTNGRIYQLVSLGLRCRRVDGVDWTAMSVAAVGRRAGAVLANTRQRSALERLLIWLIDRFELPASAVVGADETPRSQWFRPARKGGCTNRTGWPHDAAVRVRRELLRLAEHLHVRVPARASSDGPPGAAGCPRAGTQGTLDAS